MVKKLDPKLAEKVMLKAGLKPLEPYIGAGIKWKSQHIECGKIVYPRYDKIVQGQRGCKSCGYDRSSDKRKIAHKTAKVLMLKVGLKPLEPYKGAGSPWNCKCLICKRNSSPTLASVKKGTGCKYCSLKKSGLKRRISQEKAVALMLKADLKPLEPYKGANATWKCKCLKCGKIVNPHYATVQQGGKCEYCSKTKVDPKDAVAIMLKAKLKPLEPYKDSSTKWKCVHTFCGEIVYPRYADVNSGKGGCNPCAKRNSLNHKRIPEKQAVALMLKNKMKPLEPFVDTTKKWKCRCLKCKKISYPRYADTTRGHTCVYCAGNKVDEKDAIKLMLKSKLQPLQPYKNANSAWECKCLRCGKIVKPHYASITMGQGGCRYCAIKGINMNVPSYLYLITNEELNSHKVGMGNHKKNNDRLGRFLKDGWKTFKVWQTNTGAEAIDIESEVLRILRKELNFPIHLSKEQIPKTQGHTETVSADSITLLELEKIIKRVIKGYRN